MTLTINGTPVPVTWEHEETLNDVLLALQSWTKEQGHLVVSVLANGQTIQGMDPTFPRKNLNLIELETCPEKSSNQHEQAVLVNYLRLLIQAAQTKSLPILEELRAEFPWITAALNRRVLVTTPDWKNPESVVALASVWLDRVLNPASGLTDLLAKIREWGTLIHQGKDREAMKNLEDFSKELQVLSASGLGSAELWSELNGFLSEIAAAMVHRDFILVADLLEYEIVPRIENLGQLAGT